MRADGLERVDLLLPLKLAVHHPHAVLGDELRLHLARREAVFETHLELAGRLGEHVGEHVTGQPEREEAARHGERR